MNLIIDQQGSSKVAVVESPELVIGNVQDALDLMANARYQDCDKILISKSNVTEDFFELKTRLAGEILQKYTNYGMKFAVYGDFDVYGSKSLKDFIYECNQGKQFFFLKDREEALRALHASA